MMHLNNHVNIRSGFTLIEVMLSVAIAAIMLTPVFTLQVTVFERMAKQTKQIQVLFAAQDFRARMQRDPGFKTGVLHKDMRIGDIRLLYELKPTKQESWSKHMPHIHKETITATWGSGKMTGKKIFVAYVYVSPIPSEDTA